MKMRIRLLSILVLLSGLSPAGRAFAQIEQEPEPGPRFCGDVISIPRDTPLVSLEKGVVTKVFLVGDPTLGVPMQAWATNYTCTCDSGTCYPLVKGDKIGCTSSNAQTCTLQSAPASGTVAFRLNAMACGNAFQEPREDIITQRQEEVDAWMAAYGVPPINYRNGTAVAPFRHKLIVEMVGGAEIIYPVPSQFIDPATGYISPEVAPGTGGSPSTFRATLGATRATCDCSNSSSGACYFSSSVCTGSLCNGTCSVNSTK